MKLYYNPLSTYSQKVMLAFHEKGISFTPEVVNLMSPDGRDAYLKINPLGKVPFLKPSDDWQVPESTSIIEYLDDKFPDKPRLIPQDRETARQVRFMDRMSDFYYNDPVVELVLQGAGYRPKDQDRASRAQQTIAITYAHLDKRLASQPWLCGKDFTMADCSAIPAMYYAQMAAPFSQHANVAAYWQRAQQRPSYVKVRAEFEPIWKEMQATRKPA